MHPSRRRALLASLPVLALSVATRVAGQEPDLSGLVGTWVAEAFGGEIHERWELGADGSIAKAEGWFVQDGDTTYSERVVIGSLGGRTYLIAHPSTGGLLVWEAVEGSADVTFENPNLRDPRRIEYLVGPGATFTRTLHRVEGGTEVATELFFRRRR